MSPTWSVSDALTCVCGSHLLYQHDDDGFTVGDFLVCSEPSCQRLARLTEDGELVHGPPMDPDQHADILRARRLAELDVELDPAGRLRLVLDQHGPSSVYGLSPAQVVAIVTGRRDHDWNDALSALYQVERARLTHPTLGHGLSLDALLDQHELIEEQRSQAMAASVFATARLSVAREFDRELGDISSDYALSQWDHDLRCARLNGPFSSYCDELTVYGVALLVRAVTLEGLRIFELRELLEATCQS